MSAPADLFRAAMLATFGRAPEVIEPGRFLRFATSDRRSDTAGWCKLFDDLRGGVFGCYRQGISQTWAATDLATMTREQRLAQARQVMAANCERQAQQQQQWAANAMRNAATWEQCVPLVPGDPCTLYLKRRGFGGVWPLPACLRLHRALPYWHEGESAGDFSAMVAPIVASDGRMVALHRTYLTRNGRKAEVPTVRKLTAAAGPMAGACIPLHKPAHGVLGIAEGIESALAGWLASGVPTVAAYSAGNLAAWRWPVGMARVLVFTDADPAGRKAASELVARAVRAGLQAEALMPSEPGTDWADVWAAGTSGQAA